MTDDTSKTPASKTPEPKPSAPKPSAPKPRRLLRTLLWSGGGALAAATVYLVTMTVLWVLHVGHLRSATDDLSGELKTNKATLEETTTRLEASQQALDAVLESIVESANDKAQAQDYQLIFLDIADYMADCADEAGRLVGYVYDREHYWPNDLRNFEDDVRAYYRDIMEAFNETVAEMEEGS
jgi:hypothetical protein